ncbi:MAG: DUF4198 domain-containing protein [Idiomarina sp.]|nr:DUF4198 domain-containing protein [Idiomarina sp.]
MKATKMTTAALLSAVVFASLSSTPAHAHRAWILPQVTVVAGDEPMVSLEAAISNDIFVADYRPFNAQSLLAYDHAGQPIDLENVHSGRFRTLADLPLTTPGTYRVVSASAGLNARWVEADGTRGGFPGRGQGFDDDALMDAIPEHADNVQISQVSRRIETFITHGAPRFDVIEPTGRGLEMRYVTHPNDLFSGETAYFQLLIDGEPAAHTNVTLIKDGMRYRNQQQDLTITSNSNGELQIPFAEPGMYWLEARYEDEQAQPPATKRSGSYVVTLEVLPE